MIETSFKARVRAGVLALAALAAFGGGAFFQFQNSAHRLGGGIAASKTVWLFAAVTLWFFMSPLVAWGGLLIPRVARAVRLFSLAMWVRGILELYLLYGPKIWSPLMGITHDLGCIVLLLGVPVLKERNGTPDEARALSFRSWLFLGLLVLSLVLETHHAALFLDVVKSGTQGEKAIWFADESSPVFQQILFRTRVGNGLVLFTWSAWLLLELFAERRSRTPQVLTHET